jgi:hypothetical protein
MLSIKKTLTALAVCSALVLGGCATTETEQQTTQEAVGVYEQFVRSAPSFEPQSVGHPEIDRLFAAVAAYAQAQYNAMKLLNESNVEGRQLHETLEAAAKAKGVPFDANFIRSANLAPADVAHLRAFYTDVESISRQQVAQSEAGQEVVAGVFKLYKQRKKIFRGMSTMEKIVVGAAFMGALSQAGYGNRCNEYFQQSLAMFENARNATGQR